MEGIARQVDVDLGAACGGGGEVPPQIDAEGALRFKVGGEDGGDFHVEVVSFSRRIVSSRIPFVSCLYSIVFQNMKNTVRIQSTRYVLTHALYHHFSNTV